MNILSNYPDVISTVLIPMIIALFALSFPLLIQTITRIDDKYKSIILIETFRNDWRSKWFLRTLFSAVVSGFIWVLQFEPLLNLGWIVDYSALILVAVTTIALIIMTFFIVDLIYVYYNPDKLLSRLIKQHNNEKNVELNINNFIAISKILIYSIRETDETLAERLWKFYFSKINELRKDKRDQEIIYPKEYYDAFLETNEILCEQNKRAISRFNNNTINDLFFDGRQQTIISKDTYSFLWKLILQYLHYNREDFVLYHWQYAHQFFSSYLKEIYPEYDQTKFENGKVKIINLNKIDKRKKERNDFLDFHFAFGGMLMYMKKYEIIKKIISYTQNDPPKHVLIPEFLHEIVEKFLQLGHDEYYNFIYYRRNYYFPGITGINTENEIRRWIRRYLAVLFIRLYTYQNDSVINRFKMPTLPEDLAELNRWKDEMVSLEYFVDEFLSQKEVLENLGFGQFNRTNWFEEHKKVKPSEIIENYKKQIEEKFDKTRKEQSVSESKEKAFHDETIKLLTPVFEKYKRVFDNKEINNYHKYFIGGHSLILPKTAFTDNQDVSYLNTDSITAESVQMNFEYHVINSLILMNPKKYFLKEENVFEALNELGIDVDNYVILSIGLNLEYFQNLPIDGLKQVADKWYYNDYKIISIENYSNELTSQSLFVLKRENLPNIIFHEPPENDVKKYNLEKINNEYNIYTKIIDINKPENQIIKDELSKNHNQEDLILKVLTYVSINAEIQYKPKVECVQFIAFSVFDDRGKINTLEDIEKFT